MVVVAQAIENADAKRLKNLIALILLNISENQPNQRYQRYQRSKERRAEQLLIVKTQQESYP